MRSSESIVELADALVRANLIIRNPTKDQTVRAKTYSYRYVGLDTLTADLRPVLQAHGLAVVQEAADDGVRTRIIHASGEWLEFGPLTIPAANDAQARGSAISYGRRYQYLAALGIAADEDDDGAAAKAPPTTSEPGSGEPTGYGEGSAATSEPGSDLPVAPTLDELVGLTGSLAVARALINTTTGSSYTARTIREATERERAAALLAFNQGERP